MKDTTERMPKFTYLTYRLSRKRIKNYIFRCPISGCNRSFNSVKNWNSHHLSLHQSIRYQCSTCLKWIATPNHFNDHKYIHQEARFKCGRCDKSFYFMSGLQLHKNLHQRYKTHECFANNCNRRYKWPQDLLRHIKIHLKVKYCCEYCDYTTHESRLLC